MSPMNSSFFCSHNETHFVDKASESNPQHTLPCDACRTLIVGKRFQCSTCNFNLHPFCKNPPPSFNSFLHPQHPLMLVIANVDTPGTTRSLRSCNVCTEPIHGAYYTCRSRRCDFDLHPQCTQISPHVRHVLDPHHMLELQHRPPRTTQCNVCRGDCSGWSYRCGICDVDVHYWCLWKPAAATRSRHQQDHRHQSRHLDQSYYFGHSNNTTPYWWPGNFTGSQHTVSAGGGFGAGPGMMNITGSLAVNLLSNLASNLFQNGFLFS